MEKEECREGSPLCQGETCRWNLEPPLGWEKSPPRPQMELKLPRGQGCLLIPKVDLYYECP